MSPATRVKNTFIEVAYEVPPVGELRRVQSDQPHSLAEDEIIFGERYSEALEVPCMPDLCWARTVDGFEPWDPCSLSPERSRRAQPAGVNAFEYAATSALEPVDSQTISTFDTTMVGWERGPHTHMDTMFVPMFMVMEPVQMSSMHSPLVPQLGWGTVAPESDVPLPRAGVPQPPALKRAFSVTSRVYRVSWSVSAEVLHSEEREVVSPSFALSFSRDVRFQLVVQALRRPGCPTRGSFKAVGGNGRVLLRCLDEPDGIMDLTMTFRLVVGAPRAGREPQTAPVRHDFADSASCGLPEGEEAWELLQHVDEGTFTLPVSLEVIAGGGK